MKKMIMISAALLALHQTTWSMDMERVEKQTVRVPIDDAEGKIFLQRCGECCCDSDRDAERCIDCCVTCADLTQDVCTLFAGWLGYKARRN